MDKTIVGDATFPVATFADAARHLRRPFTPAAVRFRVLQGRDTGEKARANCACYIDARLVAERLNLICPQLWHQHFEPVTGGLRCDLTVDGLTRSDVGWSRGTGTDMDLKALYSDAFKRAAVHFGVGVSLYAIPGLTLHARERHVRVWERPGKDPSYYVTDQGEIELRRRYVAWLDAHGCRAFGEPLDHGDVEDVPEPPAPAPERKAPKASDVPTEDAWLTDTITLLSQLKLKAAAIREGLHDSGVRGLPIGAALEPIIGRLDNDQRPLFTEWLAGKAAEGTPLEGIPA